MAASVDSRRLAHLFQHFTSPSFPSDFSLRNDVVNGYAYNEEDDENDDDEGGEPYWKDALRAAKAEAAAELLARPDPRDANTPDSWVTRDPSLIRLTGKHPFNSEPPVTKLMDYGFITPVPIHYVRNHGPVPQADTWHTWTVEVAGLVRRPTTFTVSDLIKKFRSVELPVTLVCAGNRRAEQNAVKQTAGFNWGPGAISTSVWRGVRLVDILKFCKITSRRAGANSVCFEGSENLPGGKFYGTSIRREVAMDPSREIILAYMQNGDQLTPDHGFPVRVIIPGFIGGRSVKWLKKIVVSPAESESYYHYKDNRVLPSHVDADLANDDAWWHKPEYIINELNINSVITTPYHGEMFPINLITSLNPYTIKGYAYSGGGKKVIRAEVTLDGGETWRVCKVDHPEKPTKYGKYWCWCFWSVDVEAVDLLGAKEIAVRAWDESHNTQPEKLNWNIKGMMNNCWFKVKIAVCRPRSGEIGLVFEHPTQPGNHSGGWMAREKHVETTNNELKKSASTPFMSKAAAEKRYSMSEIRRHCSKDSAWIVIHGSVYDCTEFLDDHPGGADSILINAGGPDCTEEFEAIHSDKAKTMLEKYRIGVLAEEDSDSESSATHTTTAACKTVALSNPRERVECQLIAKTMVSRDVRLFRFALPSPEQKLGLPVGKHVLLCAYIGGDVNKKLCMRAYTPTSPVGSTGYFDLLIRIYFKDENPNFPTGGLMSQHLESLPMNSTIEIKGPVGHIEYMGRGNFSVHNNPMFAKKLAMIAGGTGITPIYQVIQAVLNDNEDRTEMSVVYACRTEDDILLRDDLDRWAAEHPQRLKVWYMVSSARRPEEWKYGIGRVTESVFREHLPLGGDETLALACGPPAMIESAVRPNLEKLNYDVEKSLLLF